MHRKFHGYLWLQISDRQCDGFTITCCEKCVCVFRKIFHIARAKYMSTCESTYPNGRATCIRNRAKNVHRRVYFNDKIFLSVRHDPHETHF